jgi:renalase
MRARTVGVIGAGIAGLMAATRLQEHGREVTVFDKSKGVGGRMATRRVGDAVLDHGAQFFTARDEDFRARVDRWVEDGAATLWSREFLSARGTLPPRPSDYFRGTEGMTSVPRRLARTLDVRLDQRVLAAYADAGAVVLETRTGERHRVDAAILTAPVPQSLDVVDGGGFPLPPALRRRLEAVEYDPCFAVLAILGGPTTLPDPGALRLDGDPLSWIADNRRKGISPDIHAVTIHAGPAFSRSHLRAEREDIARAMLDAARPWLGDAPVDEVQVHRWLYSAPVRPEPDRCLGIDAPAPLVFAGDAFGGPRVEGAALSGLAAADRILALG